MISVSVFRLSLSNKGPVVLLKGTNDPRTLPIFIGASEAQAIAIRMEGIAVPRPLTHDLLRNLLDPLGVRLKRVEISELADNTFFARLILDREDKEMVVDARPSDAIALALRCEAPIFVAPAVMQQAGVMLKDPSSPDDGVGGADDSAALGVKPSEMERTRTLLAKAVEEENYEEAARLRDRIKELGKKPEAN